MGRHVKKEEFKVGLDREGARALRDLARRERSLRKDPAVGGGTLLREYAMPLIHARLAELKAIDATVVPDLATQERRAGERRQPAEAAL